MTMDKEQKILERKRAAIEQLEAELGGVNHE